jgi:hypothetical protein
MYAEHYLARGRVLSNFNAFLEGRFQDIENDLGPPQAEE